MKIARRHTRHIERDLPEVVSRAIGRLADFRTDQGKRFDTYRNTELGHEKAHDLIIKLLDGKAHHADPTPRRAHGMAHAPAP